MPDQSDGGIRERRAHPELAAEQRYLDRAYGRLDEMRKAASRVAEGYSEVQRGGTHQARLERDAAEDLTRRRLAACGNFLPRGSHLRASLKPGNSPFRP